MVNASKVCWTGGIGDFPKLLKFVESYIPQKRKLYSYPFSG